MRRWFSKVTHIEQYQLDLCGLNSVFYFYGYRCFIMRPAVKSHMVHMLYNVNIYKSYAFLSSPFQESFNTSLVIYVEVIENLRN